MLLFLASVALAGCDLQEVDVWWQRFTNARSIGDVEGAKRLVREEPAEAARSGIRRAAALGASPDPKLEEEILALANLYREIHSSEFLLREYEYLVLLDSTARFHRERWVRLLERAIADLDRARKGEEGFYEEARQKLEAAAQGLDDVGDYYHAGLTWSHLGNFYDSELRPKGYDNRKAAEAYKEMLDRWDRVDNRDAHYQMVKGRYEALLAEGFGPEGVPAPAGAPANSEPAPAAVEPAWAPVAVTFDAIDATDTTELPWYGAPDLAQTWDWVFLSGAPGEGTTPPGIEVPFLQPPLRIVREKFANYALDVDADGKGDVPVKDLRGREPTTFERTVEGVKVPGALLLSTMGESTPIQREQLNFAPTGDLAPIAYRSAGFLEATIAGETIRIYDLNGDGSYGSAPLFASQDTVEGADVPFLDAIRMGKSKRAIPFSTVIAVGGALHRLRVVKEGGLRAETSPLEAPTARLRLDWKGPKGAAPSYFVVRETGTFDGAAFDLADAPDGVVVPAGNYELVWGLLQAGKGPRGFRVEILKGQSALVAVKEGETGSFVAGAPFTFEFQVDTAAGKPLVPGKTVTVFGAGKERYERFWSEVPIPEVSWRKEGAKRPQGKAEMKSSTREDVERARSRAVLWHPKDLEIDLPNAEGWEFQLSMKHKILGPVASSWK